MSEPAERLKWDLVFEPTPSEWGLRGDPYAWFLLRARLSLAELPEDPAEDRAVLRNALGEVVGLNLDDRLLPETLYVRAFAFGGMSSGVVDLHHWRDRLVPLLVDRAAQARAGVPAKALARVPRWQGVVCAAAERSDPRERLADIAKAGDWDRAFALLHERPHVLSANSWRPSGASNFTPLHQAAWHGASVPVVERLVELGAWRTLRAGNGRRPVDIARQHGHDHLLDVLEPAPLRKVDEDVLGRLDLHLAAVVEGRIRPQLDAQLRHPQSEVLTEVEGHMLWYPIPGMYGGFRVELREDHLYVESWIRIVGGSGQAHLVTRDGAVLARAGFA